MEIYIFEEDRRLFLAVILSILLHLILFISFQIRPDFSWMRHKKEEAARPADVIRFDLIQPEAPLVMDSPEIDKEEAPVKPTNIISDKDATARDMLEKEEEITDSPYAEGKMKIKEVRKSVPSVASTPQQEMKPQPEVQQAQSVTAPPLTKGDERSIEMVPAKEIPQQEVSPQQEVPEQKETVVSVPQDLLRIPLYDGSESNARGIGNVTFNIKKHDVAPYVIKMKKRIEEHWAPPVVFTYYGLTSGETVVQFKIMPDGSVEDVNVIKEKGDESLKKSSLQAIMDASPFEPIPPKILEGEKDKYLGITFTFYYIIDKNEEDPDENI